MQVINGKELFDSFVGLNDSMRRLEEMCDGKMHISIRYRTKVFESHDEPDAALQQLRDWLVAQVDHPSEERKEQCEANEN